ncbi:MAG: hypothetical protein C5B48_15910 [Candidatus Rokuibacteriota bacterium]|nr:MAG: hypothetical protein C5B48_15910 [Candidatus Rokubacteria bacterium]
MLRTRRSLIAATSLLVLATVALLVGFTRGGAGEPRHFAKFAGSDPDAAASQTDTPGEGPIDGADAYFSAERTYPADEIPPTISHAAKLTFDAIAKKGDPGNNHWFRYGPQQSSIQPGVLSFSGPTNSTASRVTAMVVAPSCTPGNCRLWVGVSGGGVWRTDDALAADPSWTWLTNGIAQNSVGALTADPNDPSGNTLYLGTGEANRCSSGCEAGVGIYKTTNGGNTWTKLGDSCTSNSTYACVTPGQDAFLGRGISKIVIDPTNSNHIYVGSALGVRGLSHVIGNGGTTRFPPNANNVGLYESNDGGATFTEVWNGNGSTFGVIDVGLDPLDTATVYASAFDQGLWRRSAALDGSSTPYDFHQVFAPRHPGGGTDRTMFAATVKNAKTRLYLTDGTAGSTSVPSEFWRTDNANQSAAALLASEGPGATAPPGNGNPFPAVYNGWQLLSSSTTASPYYATFNFCTGQCWYDSDVYTPTGMPDTVYVIGSYQYGELPCNTKGVGCGNGRSNGRAVLYSTTAGDPDASAPGTAVNRTFTDLTFDAQDQPANWCGLDGAQLTFGGVTAPFQCLWAPDSIHPDQHAIVINPSNPTQIFEGSDGGVIRTNGTFADLSSRCNSNERPLLGAASLANCMRMLSQVPNLITHVNRNLDTLQFINVAINPSQPCEVEGGTQDNGTWSNPGCDTNTWPQIIYGDGGNAGYDGTNPTWRFNEFTSAFSDSNFENGDPTKWVISSAPIVNSGEAVGFYWPQIADPNPPSGAHPIFSGAQHVWRTWAFGAGTPGAVPQDKTPNITFYEANCPEFTTSGAQVGCGDYQPLGGDLTSTTYGSDRTGGSVSWLARNKADHGTLWAATSAGRIFVTHDADAIDPAGVTWHRIDNSSSPTRFPSSIYPDANDTSHAWITYSGYNASTPTTPGHVFSVSEGGSAPGSGTFTNLDLESGTKGFPTPDGSGDLPASDIVRDDQTGKLYVSTDFGVLWSGGNSKGNWHVAQGLPRFEVMHLEIEPSDRVPTCTSGSGCPRVLYAATHSQGIWALSLPGS